MVEHLSRNASNTFLCLRRYRRDASAISVFLRELGRAYQVCVARDIATATVFNRYDNIDDVIKFLTRTHDRYLDDGWKEVETD